MTIDELIAWAERRAQDDVAFNAELAKWQSDTLPIFHPLRIAWDSSGSRNNERIVGYLKQARKEAGG